MLFLLLEGKVPISDGDETRKNLHLLFLFLFRIFHKSHFTVNTLNYLSILLHTPLILCLVLCVEIVDRFSG